MFDARHSRQARLAEIGAAGQARIAESEVCVSSPGVAGEIEARYLTAAGVGRVRTREACPIEGRATFGIMDPAALEVAQGAHAALRALRDIVLGSAP